MYSDYAEQLIDIKIIKKNLYFFEVYPDIIKYSGFDTDKNYNMVTNSDIGLDNYIWNDDVWNNFDYTSYYQKCIKCNKEIKQIGIKNIICKDCKEKEVKDEFINNFKKSSPNDKLKFYGKQKLLTLAKNKKIKGLYTMTKIELRQPKRKMRQNAVMICIFINMFQVILHIFSFKNLFYTLKILLHNFSKIVSSA